MHKKLVPILIFIITTTLLFPRHFGSADESSEALEKFQEWSLERYVEYFYNRYSTHFDKFGLVYKVPEYNITNWKAPVTARENMFLAMYYRYRAQEGDYVGRKIIRQAVFNAKEELDKRPPNTQSFEDAQAIFLLLRVIHDLPEIFTEQEREWLLSWIIKYIEPGIKVPDTENRAIISAVHWQYIIDYLSAKDKINAVDKKRYSKMIKDKIDFAIKTNITKDYWYIEGRFNNFTPHYHAVSAYMLMIYSKLTGEKNYNTVAFKMYENLKRISFDNGMVEARLGHRPLGLGAQFYLMVGILGKSFNDNDYGAYLFYGSGDRFFSDPDHPNRLEYHSTLEESDSQFHDDYSFTDAAELALAVPSLDADVLNFVPRIAIPKIIQDSNFIKKNTGREIIFKNYRLISGSYGNWSRITELKN